MPRRRLNSVKKAKKAKGISIKNKNSVTINFSKSLGPSLARRDKAVPSSFRASKLSGSQQLLSSNNAHYGNPASRYIQAVPSSATVAYERSESSLKNNADEFVRLGISAIKQSMGNPVGIKVDNTPSKTLVQDRPKNHLFSHLSSSNSISGYNKLHEDFKDEDTSFNPPIGYANFLGHPRANGAYMTPQEPSSRFSTSSGSSNSGIPQQLFPAPPVLGSSKNQFRRGRSAESERLASPLRSSSANVFSTPKEVKQADIEEYRQISGKMTGSLPASKTTSIERTGIDSYKLPATKLF
jgi:hypothetical protein